MTFVSFPWQAAITALIALLTLAFYIGYTYSFIRDMKTNHLPHIYEELRAIKEAIIKLKN